MLFSLNAMRSIIDGASAVDLPHLDIRDRARAREFLRSYGFDLNNPEEAAELDWVRRTAADILQRTIVPEGRRVPREILTQRDVPTLLVWASNRAHEMRRRRAWSCALLRVAHSLTHAYSDFNESYSPMIRRQIETRYRAHLRGDDEALTLGEGDDAVELERFDVRPIKTLQAATLKLLNAAENVGAGVFDWLGVRFVTRRTVDALLVVRYLRRHKIISFPNIVPRRCRNSLVDLNALEPAILAAEASGGTIEQKITKLRAADRPPAPRQHSEHNSHSASDYRSIQFTCRELVRLPRPGGGSARFFFPYEVQILDADSYAQATRGPASHAGYKRRQLESVRARVPRGLEL